MAAVLAAILAGFLAGAVALLREHRLQQRRLIVAARVVSAGFDAAERGVKTALTVDRWAIFNALPGKVSFAETWDAYKGDLAGHLTWQEWQRVERAVTHYLALTTLDQTQPPTSAETAMNDAKNSLERGIESLDSYCVTRLSVWGLLRRRFKADDI